MSDERKRTGGAVPATIGRYQITGTLGFGAMGAVYKAWDPLIKRTLAIKTIRLDVPRQSPQHQAFIERFYQEARISGTLSHPSIVTLFDVGEDDGAPFLAMEFVDGRTIGAILEEGVRFKPERVIGLVSQVAEALDYAHSRGVVHRDVKPTNLMVSADDRVKVTDFGIAKLADSEITHSGALLGTPSYMSPEQAMGEKLDGRSDIFSLGVVAFEMLSGLQPFPGPNVTSILYKLVHVEPVEPADLETNGLVPQKWREVFRKVLAKKPESRYPTASAFVQDLEYCLGSWFAGIGDQETASLAVPVLEERTVTLPQMPLPDVDGPTFAGPLAPPPGAATLRGGEGGAATLVLAPAAGAEETVLLLPRPSAGALPPAEGPPATLLMSPPGASQTLPPEPTVRVPPARPPAAASTARPRPRGGVPAGWVLGGGAAVLALALAIVGWAFWERSRAAEPAVEPPAAVSEPEATPAATSAPPPATSGTLRVESDPPGARVRVNGEAKGATPLDLADLPFGAHKVRVDLRGYEPQSRDVTVDAASPAALLRLTLARPAAPVHGTADVVSTPAGAAVSVDGRPAGVTPLAGLKLKPGRYRLEVSLPGHETWSGTVEVAAGQAGRVAVRLVALPSAPAPPTPEPVDTERVYENVAGKVDTPAKKLSGRSPSYPSDRARRLKREERVSVVVRFVVTETGEVQDVTVVESAGKAVDDVVVAAVRTWKYQPAAKQGVPVKVLVLFKQTFLGG
jgi:serine/threonine-protein kinase